MARSSREVVKGNVFLSWSGERGLYAAKFFHAWLPNVLPQAKPWLSDIDIEKGTVGLDEIKKALVGKKVGVFFLTPENRGSVWMPYEAGALANEVGDKSRVCTYLLGGLKIQHVQGPFGMFQHTRPDCEDTRKLVHTVNKAIEEGSLPDPIVDAIFEKMWPGLASHLEQMPKAEELPKPLPTADEMIAEILELSRAAANRGKQNEWMDQLNADAKDVLPPLIQLLKDVNLNQVLRAPAPPVPPRAPLTTFCIKLAGDDEIKKVEGTAAVETAMGQMGVVIGSEIVAKFESVESWWKESAPGKVTSPQD
jgi:hypothetical protein